MADENKKHNELLGPLSDFENNLIEIGKSLYEIIKPITDFQENVISSLTKISETLRPILEQIEIDNGLSKEELDKKYEERIQRAFSVGNKGWVVSSYSNKSDEDEWYEIIDSNENYILDFFDGEYGVLDSILSHLCNCYSLSDANFYFENALRFFKDEDYLTSAMYLLPLLNIRVESFINFGGIKRNSKRYCLNGFSTQTKKAYSIGKDDMAWKYIVLLDFYPSLCGFLQRAFCDGEYTFEKGIEPPYLNRNWLLHGRSTRNVTREDCIQIFNALDTIEFISEWENIKLKK